MAYHVGDGFRAMLEGENITTIGPDHNFNAAGSNGVGYKPAVADPETTELNQAWLSYTYTNPDVVIRTVNEQFTQEWRPHHVHLSIAMGFFPLRK